MAEHAGERQYYYYSLKNRPEFKKNRQTTARINLLNIERLFNYWEII